MDQTREKLHCAVCGWEWWKRLGSPDPKRCARPTCRSMRWKGDPTPAAAAIEPGVVDPGPDPKLEERPLSPSVREVLERERAEVDRAVAGHVAEELEERRRYVPIDEVDS